MQSSFLMASMRRRFERTALAQYWVREAFGHNKAIGAVSTGILLIDNAVHEAQGVKLAGLSNSDATVVRRCDGGQGGGEQDEAAGEDTEAEEGVY
jgi:hypothetical protein